MTSHAPKPSSRKRLLLFFVLTAVLLAAAWIVYFLATLNLNDYRLQAEEKLSSLLSLPVQVGAIHYNLHDNNLALHVVGMQIGDNDSTIQIDAPDILINLKWLGLLERNLKFAKISLVQPQVWVRPASNPQTSADIPQGKTAPIIISQALLQNISIDDLEILGGAVHIKTSHPDQAAQQVDITGLDGELSDIRLHQMAQLNLTGELRIPGQKEKSPWQLQGESSLVLNENNALEPYVDLDLKLRDLDLSAIRTILTEQTANPFIEGTSDLHLQIKGSPNTEIDFQTGLSSNGIVLRPSSGYTNPIRFKNLRANGRLQTYGEHPGIRDLSLQIDESRIAGSINWAPAAQPFPANIIFLNSTLAVAQVKQWLPDVQEPWRTIKSNLQELGSIHIERAEFTFFKNTELQEELRIIQLQGELQEMAWASGEFPSAEVSSLQFSLANNLWQINDGRGRLGALSLALNGTGDYTKDGVVITSLDFSGDGRSNILLEEWQIPQHALSTNGNVSFQGRLEGPLDQLSLDLQANLAQLSVSHPAGLTLEPGPEDKLTLHATFFPHKFSLDHGSLKWSVAKGHTSGTYLTGEPDSLAIDALLTIDDLTVLAEALPILNKLQLYGQADLSIRQRGLPENSRPEMVLTLRDAGLHATRHIADLSQINGRVQLTTTGLTAENLRVHLGKSPLTVQARLEDFANPRLLLDAKAPAIRADDLIFYSNKAVLRDIKGHLEIDRDGLAFAPVDVRLDGGTTATVLGSISFHAPFDVQLDITSEFARIDEVISLWTDRSETSKKRSASTGDRSEGIEPKATIKINALVKNGDLYGMSFRDAVGIIVPTHDRLSIHPLDFSVGEGFCNAQVLTDFSADGPTLLRISGHAQDVDALEVYRELLNQKNIVRGKLRGDFYVNGEIGSNYLPSSYGNFSIQVHDGVLHQFPVLSKVFSLLNISQIFALQLPDMDVEGMPFDLLSANFQLDKGILKSEDLNIQSEAMNQSYAGQFNLIEKEVDLSLAIHPLGTVDKIVSRIPVAGWLLTGEDKALLTAHFNVTGKAGDASVEAKPLDTLAGPTIGLLQRTLGLPFKLIEDPQILWGGEVDKKPEGTE
jgi:hypothetical protein